MSCLYCGAPVLETGVCSECGLKQEYLQKAWNTSLHYYNQGLKCAKVRDLTGAENALKMALRYHKGNVDARNLLGLVYYETGQVFEALEQWVISTNYQSERNLATRYMTLVQGNQNELNAYEQAAKKYNLTLHYMKQKSFDLALIQLKKILSDNPHFVKAYLLLALLYIQEGNIDRAKKALQRVQKIDKYNPTAEHYVEELAKNGKKYAAGVGEEDDTEEDYDDDYGYEDEEELDEEESARRKIREIIERGAAAEDIDPDQNLEVGSYREIKYGKHNVLYLAAGLLIGIAAMFFLIMPASIRSVQNEDLELKSSYSAELSGKNVQIAGLKEQEAELTQQVQNLREQLDEMIAAANESTIDDSILSGIQSYMNGEKEEAIATLGTIDLNSAELSEITRSCVGVVVAGCEEELAEYRSAGITAYSAENYDEAVRNLLVYCNLKPDDAEARYTLAKTYEAKGSIQEATTLYEDINTRFPDSEFTSTIFE